MAPGLRHLGARRRHAGTAGYEHRGIHGRSNADQRPADACPPQPQAWRPVRRPRSEEHTSELQSPCNLVCRLLLEKKKKKMYKFINYKKKKKNKKNKIKITQT